MMTAEEAKHETDLVTEAEIAQREHCRVERAVENVMSEAASIQRAFIQHKRYEAVVNVPDVKVMVIVERRLRSLGYKTLGAPGSLYVSFSWGGK